MSLDEHAAILHALRNRNAETAQSAMRDHILSSSADLRKHLGS